MNNILKGRLTAVRITLLAAMLALVATGIVTLYAVGHPAETGFVGSFPYLADYWIKQVEYAAIGFIAFVLVNRINYRRLGEISYWMYIFILLLLAVVLLGKYIKIPFVPETHGSYRWIRPPIKGYEPPAIQPSEFCKLAYILALAWYLRYRSNYRSFTALIVPFILTLLPMVLILLEPDMGTALLMMPAFLMMVFIAGAKIKHLLTIILLAIIVSPLLWHFMESYQRIRISGVLLQTEWVQEKVKKYPALGEILVGGKFSENRWRSNWGYQLIHSKFAVASGGAAGYGFRHGPFIKHNFLAERHNDFIFAVIAHQWGFLGSLVLVGLYAIIVGCGLEIAWHNTDPFGKLLAVGIVVMFTVETIVNISMTVGLMPITGLTLPLVSYGGSSLVVNMVLIGLLNNVGRCRPFSVAPKSFK